MTAAALRVAGTSPEFSLSALAHAVLAETDSEDREQILKEIEQQVPAGLLAEAFHQALPAFVARIQGPKPPVARPGGRNSSAKVTAIRETWRRFLEGRYTAQDGSFRRLGDFGHGDLIFMAGELETKAAAMTARAQEMTALAAAMEKHKAGRVRDLPDAVLAAILGQAAA